MLPFMRLVMSGVVLSFATACITTEEYQEKQAQRLVDPALAAMYAARPDERFPLPALDVSDVDPQFLRQEVSFSTTEPIGTLVVAPEERFLYLVREGGKAIRYGVGVGRAGYEFEGNASIGRIAEWPRWTPTPTMIAENPEKNGPWAGGMDPGLTNPLGARALYLYRDGRDTLYRIHGTNEPQSIGQSVSSGCIRLFNQDVIDLATRVPVGTRVVVLASQAPSDSADVAGGYGQSVTMTD